LRAIDQVDCCKGGVRRHSSSVMRPGKLRTPWGKCFLPLRARHNGALVLAMRSHPSFAQSHGKKNDPSLGREAERRQTHPNGVRIRRRICANAANTLPRGARRSRRPPRRGADRLRARSPLGAPQRRYAKPQSLTRPRAALPGITGYKREDPLRHQCSEHLAVRSRAGRADARSRPASDDCSYAGRRARSVSRRHRLTSPYDERTGGRITITATYVNIQETRHKID
jgi:hypothetical protein